jgi:hypothetical protein
MLRSVIVLLAVVLSAPLVVQAHHGWTSYDQGKPITVTGAFEKVIWANPHGSAEMKWQDRQWQIVLAPLTRMEARGLTLDMISKGQSVTLTGYARSDGVAEMRVERITVGDKTIELR